MISRYSVLLNGEPMNGIHSDLYISDIIYPAPQINVVKNGYAKRQGAIVTRLYREKLLCTVKFQLQIYGTAERQAACQQVCKWAQKGGMLETSDRPGQRLRVICEAFPTITSAKKWMDDLTITFAAYVLPYWEEIFPVTMETSDTEDHKLYVPGNAEKALVDVTATLTGATDTLTIYCGDTHITLSGLSGAADDEIRVAYDDQLFLQITKNGQSILNKRTGSDALKVASGEVSEFRVNGPADVKYSVRGLWQ